MLASCFEIEFLSALLFGTSLPIFSYSGESISRAQCKEVLQIFY